MNFFLLQVKTNNVIAETASAVDSASFPIWFWIALIEFAIIVFLVFRLRKKREKLTFGDLSKDRIRNAKKSDVDMENLMNSINGSKELYKQLSRTCHPDRFINNSKQ
jgi:hypothetical protein